MSELKSSRALVSFAKQLRRQKEIAKDLKEKRERELEAFDSEYSYASLRYSTGNFDAIQDLSEKFCKALRDAGIDLDQFMTEVESC